MADRASSLFTAAPRSHPHVKRFVDAWFCDPDFPAAFEADPAKVLAGLGIDLDPDDLSVLVSPEETGILTRPDLPRPEGEATVVAEWRDHALERFRAIRRERRERSPVCPALARWRWRQIGRLGFELGSSLAGQIRHIPFAFELTSGCSGRCWFCGVSAQPLDGVFERSDANVELFRGLLARLVEVFGAASASDGILYWATDPIDHPEYESFIDDYAEIVGVAPTTVTALAGRQPDRAASILDRLKVHPPRTHRFSLLSPRDYHTVIERFDAEDLASVELLPQYRKDLGLKFAVGRARTRMASDKGTKIPPRTGTIACLSGLIIDLVGGTIRLSTPCPGSDATPDGVHESSPRPFCGLAEGLEVIEELVEELKRSHPTPDLPILHAEGVEFLDSEDPGVVRVVSSHRGLRIESSVRAAVLTEATTGRFGVEGFVNALVEEGGATVHEAASLLDRLADAGVVRWPFSGEQGPKVILGRHLRNVH
ncbi:MAG: hypothetical protein OSA40_13360 [Phycisphaerales bacterium]|nr:hypothetical protein [Phycisphaerales bacterium]